jgi:hypothetical protein
MTKLEVAANDYAFKNHSWLKDALPTLAAVESFVRGAEWRNANLWHDAQGDDLPEIDREVIVLCNNGKVCFGHRPKEYWDGKNIATGEVTRHYPKRYDKGGWNIPDVRWWLDVSIPNLEEQQ